jgi:flagellar basal body-associated protein FliL
MFRSIVIAIAILIAIIPSLGSRFSTSAYASDSRGSGGEEDTSESDEGVGSAHVKVKPLNISIIQDGKIRGLLYISMSLETSSRDLRDGVVNVRPKLRDAYIRTLTRYASNQMNPNKPVSIMLMKKLLQRSTDRILGDSTVTVIIGAAHVTGARM